MSISTGGPEVRLDITSRNTPRPEIDRVVMANNLNVDFPELTGEDWSRVIVRFRDNMLPHMGGETVNLAAIRRAKLGRAALRVGRPIHASHGSILGAGISNLEQLSEGRDILIVVNLQARISGQYRPIYDPDHEIFTTPMVLAHEFKHAADNLNTLKSDSFGSAKKPSLKDLGMLGLSATGLSGILGGVVTGVAGIGLGEWGLAADALGIMTAGVVATGACGMWLQMDEQRQKKNENQRLFDDQGPSREGEMQADAYAIATRHKWEAVIQPAN